MTRTEEELRKEYEEYSRMYNNPKHWEGWLIDEIRKVENYLEEACKLAEFLTIEAGKHSKRCKELKHKIERKAEAHDRLMSGGKKTPKEWANIFGKPIAMDRVGAWYEYKSKPSIGEGNYEGIWVSGLTSNDCVKPISVQIDFNGDWKDSLTLPDGWEDV